MPTFDGELRADKPIGIYWLMAVPMRLLGATDWSARLASCAALAGATLATFALGRRLFDARTGHRAMVFLALAPLALAEGTLATTDATLLLCTTLAWLAFVAAVQHGYGAREVALLALALAAAQYVKGPVGLAVPMLGFACAWVLLRADRALGARFLATTLLCAAASVLLFAAWWFPADAATGGEYFRRGFEHHVLERTTTALEGHGGGFVASLAYYAPVVLLGLGPGLVLLPAAWRRAARSTSMRTRVLLAASVPALVLFTCVATKLPHYVLSCWPALALGAAAVVEHARDADRGALRIGAVLTALVAALEAVAFALAPGLTRLEGLGAGAWSAALVVSVAGFVAARSAWRGDARRASAAAACGAIALYVVLGALVLPVLERTKVAPELARRVNAVVPRDVGIARAGFVEPSFDFRVDRAPIRELEGDDAVRAWAAEPGRCVLVLPRERLARLGWTALPPRVSEVASARGFNLSKGKPVEVVALLREAR